MMAEPRRVPFISLSPVRRREGESPVLERETGGAREAEQPLAREGLKLPDQQEHHHPYDNSRVEPPSQPFESCTRPESHAVSLPREISRPELTPKPPQPPHHRESPRPEPPPPPPHQQLKDNQQESPPPLDQTVRFELILKDPTEESCVEFSYPELLWSGKARKKSFIEDPFDNEEHERHEVEMLAKKFETKYVSKSVEIVAITGMNPDNF
ncbi:hypothetical protein E2320_003995 [Naja naja]|nr:hypothetical protein E2320_003995 [Naja naja]